jgi:hypothetical protein
MADDPTKSPQSTAAPPEVNRLQALFDELWNDKSELGRTVRKRAKEKFPDIRNPDEDAEAALGPVKAEVDAVKTQLKEALDKIAARDKADADLKVENDLMSKMQAAKVKFNLTDSGYDKMMTRMRETGNVTDADAAAAWVVSQMPKPEPTNTPTWLPQESNLFGTTHKDEQWEALHKDPRKYFDDQLRDFVRDPDKYVRDTLGTA